MSAGVCGSIAGLGSGVTEALFVTPFERVKILLQTQKGSLKGKFGTKIVKLSVFRV